MLNKTIYQGQVAPPQEMKTGNVQAYIVTEESNGYAVWAIVIDFEKQLLEQHFVSFHPEPSKFDAIDTAVRNVAQARLQRSFAAHEEPSPLPEGPLPAEPLSDADAVKLGERIMAHEGGHELEPETTSDGKPICRECNRRIGGHYSNCPHYVAEHTIGTLGRASVARPSESQA